MRVNTKQASWQTALGDIVTELDELLAILELSKADLPDACQKMPQFPLRVPRSFVNRMKFGDPTDPLLRQVLPLSAELQSALGFSVDPLKEQEVTPIPGLLHKYHGRVLLIMAGHCAINCRYCFRRHFPYQEHSLSRSTWPRIMDYLAAHPSITEVILSGGEPLLLKDNYLGEFIRALQTIPHLKTIRFHTRLPVVIPERITTELVRLLNTTHLQVIMVMHCNHPQELDHELKRYWKKLRTPNITLFNQAVLLQGVNDDEVTLVELHTKLFDAGVLPYYLHLLDPVQGAQHFAVSRARAKVLHQYLCEHLPGYLVSKLVVEQAGAKSKVQIYPLNSKVQS